MYFFIIIKNFLQTSTESGSLFSILHQVFEQQSVEDLKKQALEVNGLSEDEFQVNLNSSAGLCNSFYIPFFIFRQFLYSHVVFMQIWEITKVLEILK